MAPLTLPAMRYAAFLRGVTPMNAKMPVVRAAFEAAGFSDVATVLASGNVVFSTRGGAVAKLERAAEAALEKHAGRSFMTIIRSIDQLAELVEDDPFGELRLPAKAKRVVTFLRGAAPRGLSLPVEHRGAKILAVTRGEVLTAYVPVPGTPVFMTLIEKTFGKDVTTRTWDTVKKVIAK